MNEEREMIIRKRGLSPSVQRRAAFQEVPGESEADAVRDAFLQAAGTQPASAASVLGFSDDSTRARAVTRMQEERGNGFVQRVVAEERGTPGRLMGLSQDEMVGEVQQRKGSGSTLPEAARQPLEQHMGADLTKVRVHTDSEAVSLSRELEASAFTVGSDIFFAEGQYDPSSSSGLGLLAHEIAHVGQQGGLGTTPFGDREVEHFMRIEELDNGTLKSEQFVDPVHHLPLGARMSGKSGDVVFGIVDTSLDWVKNNK